MAVAELATRRSQEQELRIALREIRDAIDAYKQASDAKRVRSGAADSGYPPSLEALAEGVIDPAHPRSAKLYFLRRLPRDPLADPAVPAAATWGLRSYESEPDRPQPGRDVFDVYSLSPKVGLNGVPYREW
jgi:general secretion pathway protein G